MLQQNDDSWNYEVTQVYAKLFFLLSVFFLPRNDCGAVSSAMLACHSIKDADFYFYWRVHSW
jgi:hypothetical protein